jgi:hypothetical protein
MVDSFKLALLILVIIAECRRCKAEWTGIEYSAEHPRRVNWWLIILLGASPAHYLLEATHVAHLIS